MRLKIITSVHRLDLKCVTNSAEGRPLFMSCSEVSTRGRKEMTNVAITHDGQVVQTGSALIRGAGFALNLLVASKPYVWGPGGTR